MKTSFPGFRGGMNIAFKIPRHVYDRTITFYRDILGFELLLKRGKWVFP